VTEKLVCCHGGEGRPRVLSGVVIWTWRDVSAVNIAKITVLLPKRLLVLFAGRIVAQ